MARFVALIALGIVIGGCSKKEAPASAQTPVAGSAEPATSTPKEGDVAPDVDLPLQDGKRVKLSQLRGQMVVVYFYPKDQTPGCTVEADGFRDHFDELKKAGVTVIGVSTQDAASHKAFIEKEKLPFDLAVDRNDAIAKAFGVPNMAVFGLHARQTFLVGKDGRIKKIWRDVSPKNHASEVLDAAGKA